MITKSNFKTKLLLNFLIFNSSYFNSVLFSQLLKTMFVSKKFLTEVCKKGLRHCGKMSNQCIPNSWWCDNDVDCINGEDERYCS